jgi:flagellar biosynthetic protein FlhB
VRLGGRLAAVGLALGLIDLFWRRQRWRRSLRMTRAEVERERKEHEGDPQHRRERQRLGREAAQPGGLAIRQSDFVVAGEHRAIVLRYEGGPAAPVVVARGERLLAARLLDLARAAAARIFVDEALSRELASLAEGSEVPEALHDPVARIVQAILEGGRA